MNWVHMSKFHFPEKPLLMDEAYFYLNDLQNKKEDLLFLSRT